MGERRLVKLVVTVTPGQDRWLAAYQEREGLTNRSEAFRDILRQAMAGEAFFVDANRTNAHTDKTGEGIGR